MCVVQRTKQPNEEKSQVKDWINTEFIISSLKEKKKKTDLNIEIKPNANGIRPPVLFLLFVCWGEWASKRRVHLLVRSLARSYI